MRILLSGRVIVIKLFGIGRVGSVWCYTGISLSWSDLVNNFIMTLQNLLSVMYLMIFTASTVAPCCASSNMFQLALVGMNEVNQLS